MADVVVGNIAPLAFGVLLRNGGVGLVGVQVDDVPGVQQAGEETETAEEDVYEAVSAAEAAFDPD